MPTSTMTEEEKWKLPKDVPLPAQLAAVTEKEFPYTDKKSGEAKVFVKWEWEFDITEGDHAGLKAWGESPPMLTTENRVRQWAETLRGAQFDFGEGLNTDDLLGLPCLIVVDNTVFEKKDGTVSYQTPVTDVFPADGGFAQTDEPPF